MSTILIDRRTAVLLGELAARPTPHPGRGAVRVESRPSRAPSGLDAADVRTERRRVSTTRPGAASPPRNSADGRAVTVRRAPVGGASVRRNLRCRPTARTATPAGSLGPQARSLRGAATPKPSLHLTRRGRVVALLLLLVLVTLAFSVGRVTSTALGANGGPGEQVVVQQGDTVWSIAERIAPDSDPRVVSNDLMAVNGLASPSLEIGQHLRLP